MEEQEQNIKQKTIIFATSDQVAGAVELLKSSRTQISSIVADTEFKTILNALTLEIEANLIQRFLISVDSIRQGNNLNEQQ